MKKLYFIFFILLFGCVKPHPTTIRVVFNDNTQDTLLLYYTSPLHVDLHNDLIDYSSYIYARNVRYYSILK